MATKHVAKTARRYDMSLVARELMELIERLDFSLDEMLDAARINLEQGPSFRPLSALNRQELSRLFEAVVLNAERKACERNNFAPALPENGFQMMCYALIACPTLGQAIATASRFFEVFTHGRTAVGTSLHDGRCWFYMDSASDQPNSLHNCLVTVAGLHSFAQLFSWLIGHDLNIADVSVRHTAAVSNVWVSSLLSGQWHTSQKDNGFSFSAECLNSRVIRSYSELMELIQFFPFDLMPPDYDGWLLAERVQAYYLSALHGGDAPRLPDIAATFNVSLTTLRRRLAEENRSFQGIKDACRCDVAKALLAKSPETLSQIADRLAFTDVANFRRSFLRWIGISPAEFRRNHRRPR